MVTTIWDGKQGEKEPMPTILVADDDANIRELVYLFLRKDGFATIVDDF
jgi:CheY-like chemotaxis protein